MTMNTPHVFEDGSSIEWVGREGLRYTERGHSALVWVDFAPGFFSRGRIIRTSSLRQWERGPLDTPADIDEESRRRIVDKVILYYEAQGTKVTVEE